MNAKTAKLLHRYSVHVRCQLSPLKRIWYRTPKDKRVQLRTHMQTALEPCA